jgi:putative ABC transport system substrate-binding protein
LGVQLASLPVRDVGELEPALAGVARNSDALTVVGSAFTNNQRALIVQLAAQHRLPAAYAFAESARSGGLMSYGTSLPGMFRRAASHMDKVLQGARPADLPVEAPTTYDLVLNRTTAEALGIAIPPAVLARVTEIVH